MVVGEVFFFEEENFIYSRPGYITNEVICAGGGGHFCVEGGFDYGSLVWLFVADVFFFGRCWIFDFEVEFHVWFYLFWFVYLFWFGKGLKKLF